MRWLLPLVLVAGCGNSSKSKSDMGTPADMATLSCPETIDAYCTPSAGCVRDEGTAQNLGGSFCADGGTEISAQSIGCAGGDLIVIVQYSDSATTFYYTGGNLTAIFTAVPHTQDLVCLAGPATVAPPSGCALQDSLCQP